MCGAASLLLSGLRRSSWGCGPTGANLGLSVLILARGLSVSHGGAEGRSQPSPVDVRGSTAPTFCSQAEQQCEPART